MAAGLDDLTGTSAAVDTRHRRVGALDGLRAIAVASVVLYHLSPRALPSGYLGVDMFMVLSGFIVTGLLIAEYDRHHRIRIGAFWGRRFRRLVPALVLVLVVVSTWERLYGRATQLPQARAQGLSALFYLTNWQLVRTSVSYGGATAALSPFVHLWSLAVEEQFYLIWPLALVLLLRLGRGRRGVVTAAAGVGMLASAAWMAWLYQPGHDPFRAYYGTDTRAQAFLAGVLAALVVPRLRGWVRTALDWAGAVAVVGIIVVMLTDAPGVLYRGGFLVVALGAACAAGAATGTGPLTWCCDRGPLRGIGRVSYGIYLWHWPAVAILTPARLGFGGLELGIVRLLATGVGTAISWVLVERRFAIWRPRRVAWRGGLAVGVSAIALVTMPATAFAAFASVRIDQIQAPVVNAPAPAPATTTTVPSGSTSLDPLSATTAGSTTTPSTTAPRSTTTPPTTGAPLPLLALAKTGTVMLVGDSGMATATPALSAALQANGWRVVETAFPGVGLTQPAGTVTHWADLARQYHVDLTIVMIGNWDLGWTQAHGTAAYRPIVADAFRAYTAGGGKVLWLSVLPGNNPIDPSTSALDRWYQAEVAQHPTVGAYLDIGPALQTAPGRWPQFVNGQRYRMRDGWHLCPQGAVSLAHYVLPRLGLNAGGWETGTWRNAHWYFDPPNACTVP